jgi:hypothetical protein
MAERYLGMAALNVCNARFGRAAGTANFTTKFHWPNSLFLARTRFSESRVSGRGVVARLSAIASPILKIQTKKELP